jgi:hypothetical protein
MEVTKMMKKLFTTMVLCVFLFSIVPVAFAANDHVGAGKMKIQAADNETEGEQGSTKLRNTFNNIRKAVISEKTKLIKDLKAEDFRQFQKERLQTAVDKCNELDKDTEKCQAKLEKRTELITKLQEKDLARLQKLAEHKAKAAEELQNMTKSEKFKNFDKLKDFKARALGKLDLEKARAKFVNAKEKADEAKEKYNKTKSELKGLSDEEKKCKDDNSCAEVKKKTHAKATEMLTHAADQVLKVIEKLTAKVESAEHLSAEDAAKYKTWLSDETAKINAIKTKISAFNENSTKEEINAAFKELKDAIKETKITIKRVSGALVISRIGGVVVKSKQLEVKLNRIMERMTEAGKDTTTIQPLVDQFNAKLDTAKVEFEAAQDKFDEVRDAKVAEEDQDKVNTIVQAAQEHMKLAKTALAEAQKILQSIVKSVVANNGAEELADNDVDAAEAAADENGEEAGEVS